jgi:hypothetical protein
MIYPQLSGEPNFVLIGVSAVFGLLVIIIVYYIVSTKSFTNKNSNIGSQQGKGGSLNNANIGIPTMTSTLSPSASASVSASVSASSSPAEIVAKPTYNYDNVAKPTITNMPVGTLSNPKIKQVFNIKENIYTLDDAPAICGALGAELASINNLIDSHKKGADWCNVGWTSDGLAAYPIQYSTWKTLQDNNADARGICGKPGINLVRNDPNLLYGVNCYGVKPEPKGGEKVKEVLVSDKQQALNAKIAQFQKNMASIGVASFNDDAWSQ